MAVRATYDYDYPSRSRQELYGDDQLVHVWWQNNPTLCAAVCFRAPRAMPWSVFISDLVNPWASSDPDFVPGSPSQWAVDGVAIEPAGDRTLADLGVEHKSVISFRV